MSSKNLFKTNRSNRGLGKYALSQFGPYPYAMVAYEPVDSRDDSSDNKALND
ncbi:MAG: hypothetical protein LKK13_01980 [Bacilli bacterium]|nr:hypothetical protein [Bacilli bacterium]